jgi:N6-L-threonylcarbamoyladenine synthase
MMERKSGLILGIETSCDETAVAVVRKGKEILSNIVASQIDFHKKFGGVVPEIASRKHLELLNSVVNEALAKAAVGYKELDGVAVTVGPGLMGSLLVGVAVAKTIAYVKKLPLIGVNHLEGHIYALFLEHPTLKPPVMVLVVSGGHTSLILMHDHSDYLLVGETLDDAAGEAFDKVAKFLDLSYPGGPIIDKLAKEGNAEAISFPRAMLRPNDFNFSLSGLKTAVLYYVERERKQGKQISVPDVVASFQAAVVEVLVAKLLESAERFNVLKVALAGGVAANSYLRERLKQACQERKLDFYYPKPSLCTDNGAMVAAAGYHLLLAGKTVDLTVTPNPSLKLGE